MERKYTCGTEVTTTQLPHINQRLIEVFILALSLKGPRCFLEQETSPLLLSTGWFQERIRA